MMRKAVLALLCSSLALHAQEPIVHKPSIRGIAVRTALAGLSSVGGYWIARNVVRVADSKGKTKEDLLRTYVGGMWVLCTLGATIYDCLFMQDHTAPQEEASVHESSEHLSVDKRFVCACKALMSSSFGFIQGALAIGGAGLLFDLLQDHMREDRSYKVVKVLTGNNIDPKSSDCLAYVGHVGVLSAAVYTAYRWGLRPGIYYGHKALSRSSQRPSHKKSLVDSVI